MSAQTNEQGGYNPDSWRYIWSLPIEDTKAEGFALLMGTFMYLGTARIPQFGHTWNALRVFVHFEDDLRGVVRWNDYNSVEIGDSNVSTHSLRQTNTTVAAIVEDAEILDVTDFERDLIISAALLHDLGELTTTDLSYEVKRASDATKRDNDIAEAKATFGMIDQAFSAVAPESDLRSKYEYYSGLLDPEEKLDDLPPEIMAARMKEIYLRVTTSLSQKDTEELLEKESYFDGSINWERLQQLFSLYERYGYLITAFQQWPYSTDALKSIPPGDLEKLRNWNRAELVQAIEKGQQVPVAVRRGILAKNVFLHQWDEILDADRQGVPSTRVFFNNRMTRDIFPQANTLMALGLNPGFLAEAA